MTNAKQYAFIKKFPRCTKQDIDNATKQIDSTMAKPFDDKTFFLSVYGGFFKLRDCAATDTKSVLSILRKYRENRVFDGEVAETFGGIVKEVELISAAQALR